METRGKILTGLKDSAVKKQSDCIIDVGPGRNGRRRVKKEELVQPLGGQREPDIVEEDRPQNGDHE